MVRNVAGRKKVSRCIQQELEKEVEQEEKFYLSTKTKENILLLEGAILEGLGVSTEGNTTSTYAARGWQIQEIQKAKSCLEKAGALMKKNENIDLVAEELLLGQQHLSEILGEFSSDDLLGKIFSTFCIGK